MFQSTHPRGVRLNSFIQSTNANSFNPRTHEGCDTITLVTVAIQQLFQSTHPRGVRLRKQQFNLDWEFQSTHPRGVRRKYGKVRYMRRSFNPRTHEGCDLTPNLKISTISSFNPRTHEGCDVESEPPIKRLLCFNPRTHEGCDCIFCKIQNINIQK